MKKIIYSFFIMLALLFSLNIVNAEENRLYFTNNGDRLYYDSSLYDGEYFMKHLKMIPGRSYEDTLKIENATNYDYRLYMRVKNENQNELAQELLDNIKMEIKLDGELLYTGFANGLDYSHDGVDLTNMVYIGEFKADTSGEIVVNTKLSEEYANIDNHERASIDWEFVAEYNDLVIPINPDTSKDKVGYYVRFLSICTVILIAIFIGIKALLKRNKI